VGLTLVGATTRPPLT